MRVHPLHPLILGVIALTSSCRNDFVAEGIYRGKLVMSDGSKNVKLELLASNTALMRGLFDCVVKGTWEKETIVGYRKDGVWVSFDFPKFRILMKMKKMEEGLILSDLSGRINGRTILRSLKLKEEKPLFRREG
ncbi:MAG: hypothetical protein HN727_06295 [Opitutae bacterium]|nr:hypothetical protein [Opitutae bacterium]